MVQTVRHTNYELARSMEEMPLMTFNRPSCSFEDITRRHNSVSVFELITLHENNRIIYILFYSAFIFHCTVTLFFIKSMTMTFGVFRVTGKDESNFN